MAKIRRNLDPANCVMSLGDHLEELRARLILALLGLALGAVVSLIFGRQILHIIERPYKATVQERFQKVEVPRLETESLEFVEVFFATLTSRLAADPNAAPALNPSRIALLHEVSSQAVKEWTEQKRLAAADGSLPREYRHIVTAPAEAFTMYMKVSLIAGLILTAPWVFYQIWMFVAAGLYPKERHYVYRAVPFSAGLFIVGALFFLFIIAPITLGFFLKFGDAVGVTSLWSLQRYVSFVTLLMLVFGIAFQTPIAVFILVRLSLVSVQTLRSVRKYVVLGLAFLAAVATPPDPLSMVLLLIPLYALFELGILLSIFAEKKAKQQETEALQT
ncbi:MAG: twin-arginine translocase subunit TatC [Planctomycetes bacterium]|nr:twin-arginine translocase subunit TatC [Planctomycetota bacterium]